MSLCGREPLWSLTRYFINILLFSDTGEPRGRSRAPKPVEVLADAPLLHLWVGFQGEGLNHPEQETLGIRASGGDGKQ